MTEKLFIQIKDGVPFEHAVHPDNLRALGIDPDGDPKQIASALRELTAFKADGFAAYEMAPDPNLHPLECEHYEEPTKTKDGKWTRVRCGKRRPELECEEITERYTREAVAEKERRMTLAGSRRERSAAWARHATELAALDVVADPFNVEWPKAPDQIKSIGVSRA